jgi:3-oxoadipate enol-lactonase
MPHAQTANARLFYRWDGPDRAPVLVLSHALGAHHGMWDANVPVLGRDYRVLRYDHRGHGSSSVSPRPYDIELLARDVLGLLDSLRLGRVSFCGLSMGGMIGMWLGANAGERIERLILANTSAHLASPDAMNERIAAVTRGGMAAVADTMIERWFTSRFRSAQPAAIARVREMLLATPTEGYIAACLAVRDMDQRKLLARISAPTLVISGLRDPATPPDHAHALRDQITGAKLAELEASHVSNIEAAAEFDAAVLRFLKESAVQ